MSISEREQQALDAIASGLARSGPELASMLAMFSRLTEGEEMPLRERLRRVAGGPVWVRPWHIRREAWRWLWLVAAVALLVLALTLGRGTGKSACTALRVAACRQAPAPARPGAGWMGGL